MQRVFDFGHEILVLQPVCSLQGYPHWFWFPRATFLFAGTAQGVLAPRGLCLAGSATSMCFCKFAR